jgi:chromosome segregation ATPase
VKVALEDQRIKRQVGKIKRKDKKMKEKYKIISMSLLCLLGDGASVAHASPELLLEPNQGVPDVRGLQQMALELLERNLEAQKNLGALKLQLESTKMKVIEAKQEISKWEEELQQLQRQLDGRPPPPPKAPSEAKQPKAEQPEVQQPSENLNPVMSVADIVRKAYKEKPASESRDEESKKPTSSW